MAKSQLRRLSLFALTLALFPSAAACGDDDAGGPIAIGGSGGQGGAAGSKGGAAGSSGGAAGSSGGAAGSSGGTAGTAGSGSAGAPPASSWRVDAAFGKEGLLDLSEVGNSTTPIEVANLPDGGFVVFNREQGWLSRFLPDGRRDEAFGWDGVLTLAFSPLEPEAMLVLRDGRIVVGGHSTDALFPSRGLLARFTSRGEFDLEFGQDGVAHLLEDPAQGLHISALAELPDGGLVGAGRHEYEDGIVLFRVTPGGALDPIFANEGTLPLSEVQLFDDKAVLLYESQAIFPALDGSLLVAGTGALRNADFSTPLGTDFTLLSRGATGLDSSFGLGGVVAADAGLASSEGLEFQRYENQCLRTARLADGRIVIAGERGFDQPDWVVARYLPNGTPDPSFAGGGFFAYNDLNYYEVAYGECTLTGLGVAPDGSILLAGAAFDEAVSYGETKGLLLRLLPDGQLDLAFGTGGVMSPTLSVRVDTDGNGTLDGKATYQPPLTALVAVGEGSFLVGARPYDGSGQKLFRLLAP